MRISLAEVAPRYSSRRLDSFTRCGKEDLDIVQLATDGASLPVASRRQEILLDLLGHLAAPTEAYLLGEGWQELSQPGADEELRRALQAAEQVVMRGGLTEPLARAASDALGRFGWSRD